MHCPRTLPILLLSIGVCAAPNAAADPIVGPNGTPGAASTWRSIGATTSFSIDENYDIEEVLAAMLERLPGANVRIDAGRIVVSGLPAERVLALVERIEVDPALDDIDAMLTELQVPGGAVAEGLGSSIRAAQTTKLPPSAAKPGASVSGQVTRIDRRRFPLVLVTFTPSEGVLERAAQPSGILMVLPRVNIRDGQVDLDDERSRQNLGAWYLQPGDRIEVQLEKETKGIWVAERLERVPQQPALPVDTK